MSASRADYWAEQLKLCEEVLDGPSQSHWLRRIYARVYRFLLSRYPLASSPPPSAPMPLVDRTETLDGKEAKSPGAIHATLERIAEGQGDVRSATPARPLDAADWFTVAEGSRRFDVTRCLRLLRKAGIDARRIRQGDHTLVQVHASDRESAFRLIQESRDLLRRTGTRGGWRDAQTLKKRSRLALKVLFTLLIVIFVIGALSVLEGALRHSGFRQGEVILAVLAAVSAVSLLVLVARMWKI